MTSFPDWPNLQPLGSGERFRLLDDHVYTGPDYRLTVPAGFVFDMASSPRIVWSFVSPFDLGPAALFHDKGYDVRGLWGAAFAVPDSAEATAVWEVAPVEWSRRQVDRLFLALMEATGVAWWRRRAAYLFVRTVGRGRWKR